MKYPTLDARIERTYAARSTAHEQEHRSTTPTSARSAGPPSASATHGVIAYVTNGGYIDSNTADGMRQSLAEEFSTIYVYNLRGNQRTAGEQSRREGGKVFGGGSRAHRRHH